MASRKQAIKPDYFENFPTIAKEEINETGITDEERMLFGLSQTSGWQILRTHIDRLVEQLDAMNDHAISNGASFEDIGKNTLVIILTKGLIKQIVNKVRDAQEVCERAEQSGGI